MSSHFDKKHKNVVTLFSRKQLRPIIDDDPTTNETTSLPQQVFFTLADGTIFVVPTTNDIIIGRKPRPGDPPVTIDLEPHGGHEQGVSRHHALLKPLAHGLVLCDLDSINGTYINDRRAAPLKRYTLVEGDVIRFGQMELTLSYRQPKTNRA